MEKNLEIKGLEIREDNERNVRKTLLDLLLFELLQWWKISEKSGDEQDKEEENIMRKSKKI